jgi:hypothetical protein
MAVLPAASVTRTSHAISPSLKGNEGVHSTEPASIVASSVMSTPPTNTCTITTSDAASANVAASVGVLSLV